MPSCLIRGVRSVELVATNFDEAARFYETVWNLEPVETPDRAEEARGALFPRHWRLSPCAWFARAARSPQ